MFEPIKITITARPISRLLTKLSMGSTLSMRSRLSMPASPAVHGNRPSALAMGLVLGVVVIATATGCGSSGSPDAASESPEFVNSVSGSDAVIWAVGDGDATKGSLVTDLIARGGLDRLLYLGDVYEEGTAEEFATNYEPTYGQLAELTAPTLGDHESGNAELGYEPYWTEATGTAPPDYYSFEAGGWQILSLNSEVSHTPTSDQIAWLEEATATPGTCRLAFWHRPRFNAGTIHSGDDDVASFWRALEGRATVVVNANEHSMQRFAPRGGITQFVSGAGGHGLYRLRTNLPNDLEFGEDEVYGALRLKLRPGSATYAFVSVEGKILDSGRIACDPL